MTKSNVTIELRDKIYKIAGRDVGKQIIDLLLVYGVEVIAELKGAGIELPNLEIKTIEQPSTPGMPSVARCNMFKCTINGQILAGLQKVELDSFDYTSSDVLRAKLTIIPMGMLEEGKGDNK